MVPLMILSTLGVMMIASISQGTLSLGSLLGLVSSDTLLLSDGSGDEGNIDLTRRKEDTRSLPSPQFTAYGSPTAPSYSSYTYTGPPSPTGLASLAYRRQQEQEVEPEYEQEQEIEQEGSLLSWLAVPGLVVLGLLLLPSSIPGSGFITRAALNAMELELVGEGKEEARGGALEQEGRLPHLLNLLTKEGASLSTTSLGQDLSW